MKLSFLFLDLKKKKKLRRRERKKKNFEYKVKISVFEIKSKYNLYIDILKKNCVEGLKYILVFVVEIFDILFLKNSREIII